MNYIEFKDFKHFSRLLSAAIINAASHLFREPALAATVSTLHGLGTVGV